MPKNRDQYHAILNAIGDAITIIDTAGRFLEVNDEACRQSGYTREELTQDKSVIDFEYDFKPEDIAPKLHEACRLGEVVLEHRNIRRDGTVIPVETKIRPCHYDGQQAFICVMRDITRRKQLERKLIEYQHTLRRLTAEAATKEEQERGRISFGLHNEVAQKLTASHLRYEQAVGKENLSGRNSKLVQEAHKHWQEAMEELGKYSFELANPALEHLGLVEALQGLCQHMEETYNIPIALRSAYAGDSLPDKEIADFFYRSASELIMNAATHADAGEMSVSVENTTENLTLCVEDNGIGFNADGLTGGSTSKGGVGLLHIRERAQYLGGSLRIDSYSGQGTRCLLEVPLQQAVERTA